MSKKLSTYVLMVSRTFPSYHPRKGQETGFEDGIRYSQHREFVLGLDEKGKEDYRELIASYNQKVKIHTIRGNYDLWKKRIDKVNEGKAVLSLRYWSGSPYNSKKDDSKQVEFLRLTKAGIEKVWIPFDVDPTGVFAAVSIQ